MDESIAGQIENMYEVFMKKITKPGKRHDTKFFFNCLDTTRSVLLKVEELVHD